MSKSSKARLVITALYVENQTPTEVAARYGVDRSWVYRLKARYEAEGDDTRQWGPPWIEREGERAAAYFHAANRGKTSVVCDFNDARDLDRLRESASRARR